MWSLVLVFVLSLPPGNHWPEDQPLPTREVVIEGFATEEACVARMEREMANIAPRNGWELLLEACWPKSSEALIA